MADFGQVEKSAKWLGSGDLEPKDRFVAVFVPSKTRDGKPLNHDAWRDQMVYQMSKLFGGATTVPAFGGWLDEERGGQVKQEAISMVGSFITADEWNEGNVFELKRFIHRMGREAQQGEIEVLLNGTFWRIRSFDSE